MSENKRKLSGAVIEAMRKAGWLRNDGFALKPDFTGKYEIDAVVETMTRDSKDYNNFAVQCTAPNGRVTIPGSAFANARVLSKSEIDAKSISGADNVFYSEDITDIVSDSQLLHEAIGLTDDGGEFPPTLSIVGAVVNKDQDSELPRMPLRKYKYYGDVLRHHRKIVSDDTAFITKDLFKNYLAAEGEDRPKGVPTNAKTLSPLDTVKTEDMTHWSFTLLVADLSGE